MFDLNPGTIPLVFCLTSMHRTQHYPGVSLCILRYGRQFMSRVENWSMTWVKYSKCPIIVQRLLSTIKNDSFVCPVVELSGTWPSPLPVQLCDRGPLHVQHQGGWRAQTQEPGHQRHAEEGPQTAVDGPAERWADYHTMDLIVQIILYHCNDCVQHVGKH